MANIIFGLAEDILRKEDAIITGAQDNGFRKPVGKPEAKYNSNSVVTIDGTSYDLNGDIAVRKYGARTFSVWCGGKLLAVTVYKRGALAVKGIIEKLQMEKTALTHQLAQRNKQTAN
jgi:hypothetical protein